jgi:prolyl-tRNA synthetase
MEDRSVAMGVQFADADLLGVPIRIVIGARNLINNEVEIITRDKSIKKCVKIEDLEEEVINIITNLRESSCSLKFARYE